MSQESSIDSTLISKVVRLLNDYKACDEYSEEITQRLIKAREMLSRTVDERNEYADIATKLDSALKDMTTRKELLEKKLKRTRKIGIGISITSFIVGVLTILII